MAKATKILAVLLCSSMILTGCGASQATTSTTKTENVTNTPVPTQAPTETPTLPASIGGITDNTASDTGVKDYTYDGLTFQIPNKFGTPTDDEEQYKRWDISDANVFRVDMNTYGMVDESDDAIIQEMIEYMYGPTDAESDASSDELASIKAENVNKFKVGDLDAVSFEIKVPVTGDYDWDYGNCYITYVVNKPTNHLDFIFLIEKNTARYSYKNDYYKVIKSLKKT